MEELNKFRQEIDKIDREISKLLQKRKKISIEIGKYKKINQIQIENTQRENDILSTKNEFEKPVFKKIIDESKKIQSSIK